MASAGSLPCEEQLLCSICLHTFSDPVSTPCGHNYCKTCITGYWDSSALKQCPLCKRKFKRRPQLHVNTEFRDMVEHFNNMRMRAEQDVPLKPGEVPCDVCVGPKLKAHKTCLTCLASYCQPHLEPHERVSNLKKHQLIEPVSNLEDRVCKKHSSKLELYCPVDEMCVCFRCLKDDHATHEAVPLEHAFSLRKTRLAGVTSKINMMEQTKSRSIEEIKQSIKWSKKQSEKEMADIAEVFTSLMVSLQRSQTELIELIQEKQKAAERQAEDRVTQLGQEVAELRRRRTEIEQLLQTEDHLRLLQSCPSLHSLTHTEELLLLPHSIHLSDISRHNYAGMVKKAVAQMGKTFANQMQMLFHEVRLSDGDCGDREQPEAAEKPMKDGFVKDVWSLPQAKLLMIKQCDAVDVTLDPDTAYYELMMSGDGKQLRFCEDGHFLGDFLSGDRFQNLPFVLGKEAFSSGKFYYEVHVSQCTKWVVGVVKETFDKETSVFPVPEDGAWTLLKTDSQFEERYFGHFDEAPLILSQRPQTVGVFVDYEKGEVSFYDVDSRALIYSYTGCTFNETVLPLKAFLKSLTGTSLNRRTKLYPVVGIYGNDPNDTLVITPVARAT